MLFWYICVCIKTHNITNIDFRLIYSSILCHITFYLYKKKEFFKYFELVLVHLTILSLWVWGLSLIARNVMETLMNTFAFNGNGNTMYANLIFVGLGGQHIAGNIYRNIGFTWEAGRFSCFLVIGVFINLLLNNMRIRGNKNLLILTIGIISTFSTTGIGALMGVILLYFYNKSTSMKIWLILLGFFLIPVVWSLDIVGKKIMTLINVESEINDMAYMFTHYSDLESITPQRFTGLYLDILNWINDFWFGYNLNNQSFVESILFQGYSVWISEGIIQIFAKYGIFVGLFFYYNLFRSSPLIVEEFGYKGKYIFVFTFILISFSYDFWGNGIMLHFIFYHLYNRFLFQNNNITKSYSK